MKKLQFPVRTLVLSMMAAGLPAQAATVLDGVTVVGQTPVHGVGVEASKVPARVQSVSGEAITDGQALNLAEHLRFNFSSVTVNDAVNNPYQPDVQYRGFTASPLLGLPQGLSVYVNGVRFNEPFGDTVNWDLLPEDSLDSVNLFSGSNPLFGQNTLGGALSLRLKNGFTHQENDIELAFGEDGFLKTQFQSGNNNGEFGYYVIGNYVEEDGWRDQSPSDVRQLLGVFSWRGDDSSLNLTAATNDNTLVGNGAVPFDLMDIEGRETIYTYPDRTETQLNFLALDGDHWVNDNVQLAGNVYYRKNTITTLNGDDSDYEECTILGEETLCEDGDPSEPVEFLGFDDDDTLEDIDPTLDPDDIDGTVNTSETKQESAGFALQSTFLNTLAGRENQLIAGVSYDYADISFQSDTEFAELRNDTPADDRGTEGVGLYDAESRVRLDTSVRHFGLYFSDTVTVNDALDLTFGARYNRTRIKMNDLIEDGAGSLDGSHTYDRINPMAGLTYSIRPDLALYASYSESSRAPTPAELSCADPADPCKLPNGFVSDPPLEQVVAKSFEAGLRGGSDIRWHAGLFHTTNHDDIIFQQAGGLPSEGYFTNVGKTRRIGAELELQAQLSSVRLSAGYTWMKATFETPFVSFSPNNPLGGNRQVSDGDRIPGLPEHIFKVAAQWQATNKLSVGTEVNYRGSQFFRGDEANENEKLDGYTLVNLRAKYQATQNIEVFGRVSNLFDKDYETFGVYGEADEVLSDAYPGFDDDRFVGPGAPRTVSAGVRMKF
ncbi:MAG: TonB-dependent receptor [Motiliproteus sp.]|nr:TonB-dependent receptor [Motiliproteus sp.]MCW9050858.1 TonB-dependent receptor [Motiliproteus sp.]